MATSALSEQPVVLYHSFYDEDCLRSASEAYKSFADVSIEPGDGLSRVTINAIPGASDAVTVRREFLNYVLDLSIKKHLAS